MTKMCHFREEFSLKEKLGGKKEIGSVSKHLLASLSFFLREMGKGVSMVQGNVLANFPGSRWRFGTGAIVQGLLTFLFQSMGV